MKRHEILQLKKLSAGYGSQAVIHDISLSVAGGEFVGILGPNGSGKSTLLKAASRALVPFSGEALFEGSDIYRQRPRDVARHIAFVSQETNVDFPFTVWEIVLMGRLPFIGRLQLETEHDFGIAHEALKVTATEPLIDKDFNTLSAGERQRVVIAKALAQEPKLLFLDEPTAHLDISYQVETLQLLRQRNKKDGLTVVMVMHDLNLASEYCERIIMLKDGRLIEDGPTEKVLTQKTIEAVYNTAVIVSRHPASSKPLIIVAPHQGKEKP